MGFLHFSIGFSGLQLGSKALHEVRIQLLLSECTCSGLQVRYDQFLDDGERCFGGPDDGHELATLMLADLETVGLGVSRPYK